MSDVLRDEIKIVDAVLRADYDDGIERTLPFDGRPRFHVFNLDPLEVSAYGLIRNRGPRLNGSMIVRGVASGDRFTPHQIVPGIVLEDPNSGELFGQLLAPWTYRNLVRDVLADFHQ